MGGREGGEEEMGRPLHILAQIIPEQLRSAVISHRCAEAVCAEGESGDTRINEDNSRATDGTGRESAEGFTKEAEGWVRPKGTLGDPTAPTPFLALRRTCPRCLTHSAPLFPIWAYNPSFSMPNSHVCVFGRAPTHSHLSP